MILFTRAQQKIQNKNQWSSTTLDSILCMCLTKYGFHTGQAYSRIGRTKAFKSVLIATGVVGEGPVTPVFCAFN